MPLSKSHPLSNQIPIDLFSLFVLWYSWYKILNILETDHHVMIYSLPRLRVQETTLFKIASCFRRDAACCVRFMTAKQSTLFPHYTKVSSGEVIITEGTAFWSFWPATWVWYHHRCYNFLTITEFYPSSYQTLSFFLLMVLQESCSWRSAT